ncbi:MAG: hypothetical protein JW828_04315 [Sedimentisphaerales bacterium]|nr:hypothetical protein [Sedimentisphaerales bacterium]
MSARQNIIGLYMLDALLVMVVFPPLSQAAISVRILEPDGIKTYSGHDIMVGTGLQFLVQSDSADLWSGGLFLSSDGRNYGLLAGRDPDPADRDWSDSHLAAAGPYALVLDWQDTGISGYDLYTSDCDSVTAGDWFILDYTATKVGHTSVHLYDHNYSWEQPDPNNSFPLVQVATRDFNQDGRVDMSDFYQLALDYKSPPSTDPNQYKETDLDSDGQVDVEDVVGFADFWLWGTTGWNPNLPITDPNVFYCVTNATGASEISLYVGQTVTLYVDIKTLQRDVRVFYVEVDLSDPTLGSIDNRAYDPAHPGLSTARIIALPSHSFDYIHPGTQQTEGIDFAAGCFNGPFTNGHLARFEYTAQQPGDMTLSVTDHRRPPARTLKSLTIHQIDPNSPQSRAYCPSPSILEQDSTHLPQAIQNAAPLLATFDKLFRKREEGSFTVPAARKPEFVWDRPRNRVWI